MHYATKYIVCSIWCWAAKHVHLMKKPSTHRHAIEKSIVESETKPKYSLDLDWPDQLPLLSLGLKQQWSSPQIFNRFGSLSRSCHVLLSWGAFIEPLIQNHLIDPWSPWKRFDSQKNQKKMKTSWAYRMFVCVFIRIGRSDALIDYLLRSCFAGQVYISPNSLDCTASTTTPQQSWPTKKCQKTIKCALLSVMVIRGEPCNDNDLWQNTSIKIFCWLLGPGTCWHDLREL